MRCLCLAGLLLLFYAEAEAGRLAAQLHAGAERGASQLGLDIDYKAGRGHSLGPYFLMAFNDDKAERRGFWSMGADFKVYFGPKNWRLYVAPGLGYTSFELGNNRQETALGAIIKLGALRRLTQAFYIGLDYSLFTNWFTREAPEGFDMLNLSLRYEF